MIVKLVEWALNHKSLSEKDRQALLTIILKSVDAVPLRAMITIDENRQILVNGKQVSEEQRESIVNGARSALNNPALALVRENVRFSAINIGYLQNEKADPYREVFYKSALWYAQEEKNVLTELAS